MPIPFRRARENRRILVVPLQPRKTSRPQGRDTFPPNPPEQERRRRSGETEPEPFELEHDGTRPVHPNERDED